LWREEGLRSSKTVAKAKFKCKKCGQCCLTIPCIFAQVKYLLAKGDTRRCPDLHEANGFYACRLIERDQKVRETLIDGFCDHPNKSIEKPTYDPLAVVREVFPDATEQEADFILWNHTSFPEFWNIPKDGWTSLQCLRTQLQRLKEASLVQLS
jgi:hypothetical protein